LDLKCVKRRLRQPAQKWRAVEEAEVEKCTRITANELKGIENETYSTNCNCKKLIYKSVFLFVEGGVKFKGKLPLSNHGSIYEIE